MLAVTAPIFNIVLGLFFLPFIFYVKIIGLSQVGIQCVCLFSIILHWCLFQVSDLYVRI